MIDDDLETLRTPGSPLIGEVEQVECFELDSPGFSRHLELSSNELLCNCPVSKQPDHYQIVVEYAPAQRAIETKSFKLYLRKFRDRALFAEDLVVVILAELAEACKPDHMRVVLVQNMRGGVVVKATAYYNSIRDFEPIDLGAA